MNSRASKAIVGLSVIAACVAMPVVASAITVKFLGPPPNFTMTTDKGTDVGSGSNRAHYYAWWNSLGVAVCVGNNHVNCNSAALGSNSPAPPSGPWRSAAGTACADGSSPSSNWGQSVYKAAVCSGWPFTNFSLYGVFGVDSAPFGS